MPSSALLPPGKQRSLHKNDDHPQGCGPSLQSELGLLLLSRENGGLEETNARVMPLLISEQQNWHHPNLFRAGGPACNPPSTAPLCMPSPGSPLTALDCDWQTL